jgi:outer membrane protein OmpA-like peptidoglycan-associated protein
MPAPDKDGWIADKLGVTSLRMRFPPGAQPATGAGAATPAATPVASSAPTLIVDEFVFGKADIPSKHLTELTDLRARLVAAPAATVALTGHTDTVGSEQNNVKLGQQRADAVRKFLSDKKGVDPGRITADSAGERMPAAGQAPAKLDPDKGEKNAKNRRVEVRVTGLEEPKTNKPSDVPLGKTIDLRLPDDYLDKKPHQDGGAPTAPGSKGNGSPEPDPARGDGNDKKNKDDDDKGPVVAVGSDHGRIKVETQAKLTFESSLAGHLGEAEVTLHIDENGKLSQLEIDLTAFKKNFKNTLEKMGGLGEMLDIEATLSVNGTLDTSTAEAARAAIQGQVKGELELHVKKPRALKRVAFKLTVTAGTGGVVAGPSIEITLPEIK